MDEKTSFTKSSRNTGKNRAADFRSGKDMGSSRDVESGGNEKTDAMSLVEMIQRFISEKKEPQLARFLKKESVRKIIIASAWEVIPNFCESFSDKIEREHPGLLKPVEEILMLLSETCDPKQLIVLFVEQLKDQNDALFRVLLFSIKTCLLRVTSKRGHSLALVLKSFYDYIEKLPLPEDQNFEGKERLLLDVDENVQRLLGVVPHFVDFMSAFASEQTWKTDVERQEKRSEKQINDLTDYLIKTLTHPLAFLDLSYETSTLSKQPAKSTSRVCAETVIELLCQLHPDLLKTICDLQVKNEKIEAKRNRQPVSAEDKTVDEEDAVPYIGLSTLAYLIFSENQGSACIPSVYTLQFLFESNISNVVYFLQSPESLLVQKGLALTGAFLQNFTPNTWPLNFLEFPFFLDMIKCLVYVAAKAKCNELSDLALRGLLTLLKIFETPGRLKLLYFLLTISPREKVVGYVITMLQNEINDALVSKQPGFFGPATEKLYLLVFGLPKGEKTDLLDHSERVMGAMNLLRFLLLQDGPNENITGIWNVLPLIEDRYFQALSNGIMLSRAHYQLELKKVQEKRPGGDRTTTEISGDLSSLPKQEQIRVMTMAINTFDMLEGILGKVTELLQRRKREAVDGKIGSAAKETVDGDISSAAADAGME